MECDWFGLGSMGLEENLIGALSWDQRLLVALGKIELERSETKVGDWFIVTSVLKSVFWRVSSSKRKAGGVKNYQGRITD